VNGEFKYALLYQDALRPVAMLDQWNTVRATFVYGTLSNSPDLMILDGVTYRFIHDHLGSPLFVVNTGTGEIVQAMKYDSWGKVLLDTSPGFQPFGYAGGLYDSETGLVRFGARDYDASIGRWLSKDPIRLQGGWNLYAYASSDPVNNIDPDGLEVITGNYVISDKIIDALQRVNEYFPDQNVIVTGGNRYRDNFGQVRSSTNDSIIPKSAIYSKHLQGVAVDFIITNVPNELASAAASQVFDWVDGKYKEGPHVHADFGGKGGARNICK
jgi:RHS repeat-associated protein